MDRMERMEKMKIPRIVMYSIEIQANKNVDT